MLAHIRRSAIARSTRHSAITAATPWLTLILGATVAVSVSPCLLLAQEQPFQPERVDGQRWQITSFLDDAGLQGRFLFNIDFEADGTVWLATSDGLYSYDGYHWQHFTEADGLPSTFVRCVLVARDGTVWVGTDNGVVTYGGTRFLPLAESEGPAGPNVRRISQDLDGTLWFSSDTWLLPEASSGLASYSNGTWAVYREEDGLPSNYVSDYFQDSQGRQFALTREGLAQKSGDRWIRPLEETGLPDHDDYFWSMAEAPDLGVMAGTSSAFFVLRNGSWQRFPNSSEVPVKTILASTRDGTILTATDEPERRFLGWNRQAFLPLTEAIDQRGRIEHIKEAPDGSIWCVGFDLLLRWGRQDGEWTEFRDLPRPRFVDPAGLIWLAGGQSVIRGDGESWEVVPDLRGEVALDRAGNVWNWTAGRIARYGSEASAQAYGPEETGLTRVRGHAVDAQGVVWFYGKDVQDRNALARFDGAAWAVRAPDQLQEGSIVQMVPDPVDGVWYTLSDPSRELFRLVHVGAQGTSEVPVPELTRIHLSVPAEGAPSFFIDRQGRMWLRGYFGLLQRVEDSWSLVDGLPGKFVTGIASQGDATWFALTGLVGGRSGVSRYQDQQWMHQPLDLEHLVGRDPDGPIFLQGTGHLFVISDASGGTPSRLTVPVPQPVRGVVQDATDALWMTAGDAVLRYRSDGVPPETEITDAIENILEDEPLNVSFRGIERFKRSDAATFRFSWRFDDGPWTDFGPAPKAGLSIAALKVGQHHMEVRAQDEGLDVDPTPARLSLTVRSIPVQERWWFWPGLTSLFLVVFVLGVIALASRRKLADHAATLEALVEKRTEALRESQERYRDLFEEAPAMYVITHNRKNSPVIADCNELFLDTLGHRRDKVLGQPLDAFYTPASRAELFGGGYQRALEGEFLTEERQLMTRDGQVVETLLRALPEVDASGRVWGTRAMFVDITERQRVEREREALITELEARNTEVEAINAELERFTYTVSHDLKSPLVTIKGFLGLVERDALEGDAAQMKRDIARISGAADTMGRLLGELLELSRVGRLMNPPEDVSLSELAHEAVRLVAGQIRARGVEVEIAPDLPIVVGDRLRLLEVFQNLIDNAVKFMGDQVEPRIEVGARQEDAQVHCFVRDNGLGIDPAYHEKIFGLFDQLTTDGEGSGIGLALAKRIVEVHGGRIWVESAGEHAGCGFHFTLPLSDAPS